MSRSNTAIALTESHDPHQGHHFDPEKILLDPDAMEISGRNVWKQTPKNSDIYPFRGRIPFHQFDWGHSRPLKRQESEMVIYEMHCARFYRAPELRGEAPRNV